MPTIRGRYIIIEGADGTGKSTQEKLLVEYLTSRGINAVITQEPGGVAVAEKLRDIIKDGTLERDPWTNVMLFTASRRASWFQFIKPELEKGTWIIASRSYISTVAYQGYGEGVDIQKIIDYTRDNVDEEYMSPDKVIILSLGNETARISRVGVRNKHDDRKDTFESKPTDFQIKMQKGYETFAQERKLDVLDASQSIDKVQQEVRSIVTPYLI